MQAGQSAAQGLGRRQLLSGLAAGLAGARFALAPRRSEATTLTTTPTSPSCPASESAANPHGFRVFRDANPPSGNLEATIGAYQSWPVTDTVSTEAGSVTSTWTNGGWTNNWPINAWFYVWANRSADPKQSVFAPNPMQTPAIIEPRSGLECRVNYSTVAKANAATQCLIRYWLGRSDYMAPWLAISGTSGNDFVYYSTLSANPAAYFTTPFPVSNSLLDQTFLVMTDRPWLPSAPVTAANPKGLFQRAAMMRGSSTAQASADLNAPGVFLDYEVADKRSTGAGVHASDPDGSLNFIKRLYADIHATADSHGQAQAPAQLALYVDALNAPSMARTGLDATNLPQICRNYTDLLSILLCGQNVENSIPKSYANQIAVLTQGALGPVPYGKLFVTFDLKTTTAADARFVHGLLAQGVAAKPAAAPPAVMFWRNGAALCASTTDAQISTVLKGA